MRTSFHLASTLAAVVCLLMGCGLLRPTVRPTPGQLLAPGVSVDCGAFTFTSFKTGVRVAAKQFGEDSVLAYEDFGMSAPRNSGYWVRRIDEFRSTAKFGSELRRLDPKHLEHLEEAVLLQGRPEMGEEFFGYIPEKARTSGNAKIISRDEVRFVGKIEQVGTNRFLCIYMAGDFAKTGSREDKIGAARQDFSLFRKATQFKN